jgi:hypothetical protein
LTGKHAYRDTLPDAGGEAGGGNVEVVAGR